MDDKIIIVENYEEFLSLIDNLYYHIESAKKDRENEYKALGKEPPIRIRLEDLDLSKYMYEMLSVHKTLQSRNHNYRLGKASPKARLIAIAGICEFIKNEFMGRFWNAYEKIIGWSSDTTVYNWIWGKGFNEIGIDLIRSYSGRREFVQTLILESGIPKRRIKDVIDFFILFRRYFVGDNDIEDLIKRIASGEPLSRFISKKERKKLFVICNNAIDYTHAFSLIIEKLSKVFDFIENSDEILSTNITENIELLHKRTGIHPLEILRDENQLIELYNKVLGYVTPARFQKILKNQSSSTIVNLPSGKKLSAGKYRFIQYGEHKIGGINFVCIPFPRISLKKLDELPYNKLIKNTAGLLFKSMAKLRIYVDDNIRYNLSRSFYTKVNDREKFRGYLFYAPTQQISKISIKDEKDNLLKSIDPDVGINVSASLAYGGNFNRNEHGIKLVIQHLRIYDPELSGEKILLSDNRKSDRNIPLRIFKDGFCKIENREIYIKDPQPEDIKLSVKSSRDLNNISFNDKTYIFIKKLEGAMLFSPYTDWQIGTMKERSLRFGYKKLVLFADKSINQKDIEINNLTISDKHVCGEYNAFGLTWIDNKNNCSISVNTASNSYNWKFDQYLEFNLEIKKVSKGKYKGLELSNRFGMHFKEFGVFLTPAPYVRLRQFLFWNIIIDDNPPIIRNFNEGPQGKISDDSIFWDSNDLLNIIGDEARYISKGISRIELSICTEDIIISSDKIWIFPDLKLLPIGILNEGKQVKTDLFFNGKVRSVVFRDKYGSSAAKINLKKENEKYTASIKPYTSKIFLEDSAIELNCRVFPKVRGCRLISNKTYEIEALRDLFKRELHNLSLLVLTYSKELSSIYINGIKKNIPIVLNNELQIIELKHLSNLTLSENTVKIFSPDFSTSFKVNFRLIVDQIEIKERIIENYLFGSFTFSGPDASGLRFIIYKNELSENNIINEKLFPYSDYKNGDDVVSFQIKIDENLNNEDEILVKLNLIPDLNNLKIFHEYGRTWNITKTDISPDKAFKVLLEEAENSFNNGRIFRARDLLNKAKIKSSGSDKESIRTLTQKINTALYKKSIYNISKQVRQILEKEFAIKF